MAHSLEPWRYSVPEGPILEIGAGTGFFTDHLAQMYRHREITVSDAAGAMTDYAREKFSGKYDNIQFKILDAENTDWQKSTYALIAGNFVLQWFQNPSETLTNMAEALKPGGILLLSFPGSESYPQWRKYCLELGLPFTANPLPDIEQIVIHLSMGPVQVDYYEDESTEEFKDVYQFFRHLKRSGTSTSTTGKKLTPKQLKLLNNHWVEQEGGDNITVRYHTAFVAAKKDLRP